MIELIHRLSLYPRPLPMKLWTPGCDIEHHIAGGDIGICSARLE